MLDVVLRTCDHTSVHPERGDRFIVCDKTTLIKKCFNSLIKSISIANYDTLLWIVDDNSSPELLSYLGTKCDEHNISYKIIQCKETGFNYSALKQFEICRDKGRKWVYSVEDDYLHYPEAIKCMVEQAETFTQTFGSSIAIRPDDDVFTYFLNTAYSKNPCRVFLGKDRHWRTLHNTHNTIFTHVNVIKDYWELFSALAKFFRKTSVCEDGTINTIWSDGVSKGGPIPLLSPIPTLAIHISQGNEPEHLDYKKLWDSIDV